MWLQLLRAAAIGGAPSFGTLALTLSLDAETHCVLTYIVLWAATALCVLAAVLLTVAIERRKKQESPDHLALSASDARWLDAQIKEGQEIREWMRYERPSDKDARNRVMTWQLETANELDDRFPAHWDDHWRKTGVVEGADLAQLIESMDRKLAVLKALRLGKDYSPAALSARLLSDLFKEGTDAMNVCLTNPGRTPVERAEWVLHGGSPREQIAREDDARDWDRRVSTLLWDHDDLKRFAPEWAAPPKPPRLATYHPDQSFMTPKGLADFYETKLARLTEIIQRVED